MNAELKKKIREAVGRIEDQEPGISTERLLETISQELGVDNATVAEALRIEGLEDR